MSGASRRLLPVIAAGFLVLAACGGGGGGGGGGPTEPTPPPPGIVFTPQGSAVNNTISLASGAATNANTLVLEVRATQVTDLYGVAFDLTYPSAQLQFTRVTAGPLLGAGGNAQAVASPAGTLIVGGTHLGNVPGANGSGVILTLEFSAVSAGSGSFAFARNSALDSDGDAISGVAWLAGSVTVTR